MSIPLEPIRQQTYSATVTVDDDNLVRVSAQHNLLQDGHLPRMTIRSALALCGAIEDAVEQHLKSREGETE